MSAGLHALPELPAPAPGTTWQDWLTSHHEPGWRPAEWNAGTHEFIGDVDNPMTGAYTCTTPGCLGVTSVQHGGCSGCRKPRRTGRRMRSDANAFIVHRFSLAEVNPTVRSELLYGLQCRDRDQIALVPWTMRSVLKRLPADLDSLMQLDRTAALPGMTADGAGLLRGILAPVDRLHLAFTGTDPTATDIWDCALVGLRSAPDRRYVAVTGTLDFTPIHLDWLRELVKAWARDLRPPVSIVRYTLYAATVADRVLRTAAHRGDPGQLGLADMARVIEALMATTAGDGTPHSHSHRRAHVGYLRRLLDYARAAGLMEAVPGGFTMAGHFRTLPAEHAEDTEAGQAIPEHVLAQLDAHLLLLGAPSSYARGGWQPGDYALMYQTIYRIQRDTGRRNNEVVSLGRECLRWDEDRPVLVYDNHKARRLGRRLPIHRDTAALIQDWQQHLASLPVPQESSAYLFPSPGERNRPRRGHVKKLTYGRIFRVWVEALPTLSDVGLDDDGAPNFFPKERITPYGLRHAYAQRHADAGTHVDVLRELMDHRSVETTMGYYQVSLKRKQEAVRLLAPTAIDRHGQSAAFADDTDYELASVAVPFGNCTEPTNVKAGGKQCPIRFQCAGCNYYRPDISFLPAIAEHLTELRADRELATSTGAADWVVANMDDQITAFDEIHARLHDQLTSMSTSDREAIESAGRELRKARAVAFIPTEELRTRPHDS